MELLSSGDRDISRAAKALASGCLVAFPTETVYGLGGDAFNVSALARIFEAKNRPFFDPLIVHIADIKTLDTLVLREALDREAAYTLDLLAETFWPGPLTLVLPKRPCLPDLVNAGLPSVAVRFPSNETARLLIERSTGAVAAPSANPFGCLSPTRALHVVSQLGDKVDFIIDGGKTDIGLESTVLDITSSPCRLLRPGGVSRESLEACGVALAALAPASIPPEERTARGRKSDAKASDFLPQGETGGPNGPPVSPGLLKSHYAPRTPLVLYERGTLARVPLQNGEGRLYFAPPASGVHPPGVKILSENGALLEAAANFFDMLHELDNLGLAFISAEKAPEEGLGAAINDRLKRAAAKTPVPPGKTRPW